MAYTLLPPGPEDPTTRFDLHQFARRSKAVSSETGIDFNDYKEHMHLHRNTGQRRGREFVPAFANNAKQLRKALAQRAWLYSKSGSRYKIMPEGLENDFVKLKQLTEMRSKEWASRGSKYSGLQRVMVQRHNFCTSMAGGYLEKICSIAYMSWKLGYSSCDVAAQLYMTPCNVRIILYRLCETARKLGYETFPRLKHSYKGGSKDGISVRYHIRKHRKPGRTKPFASPWYARHSQVAFALGYSWHAYLKVLRTKKRRTR